MKKKPSFSFIILVFFTTNLAIAQFTFEKGYFIDRDGNKVDCLIENKRWLFFPKQVFYKLTQNSDKMSFTVENCEEFRIGNEGVYKRVKASFPITQSQLKKKETTPEPEMIELDVFVQTIVEGNASLFWYNDDNGVVYLYQKEEGPIQPLIYKKYVQEDQLIRQNNRYKAQLIKDFNCGNAPIVQKTKYQRKTLIAYFEHLNTCSGNNDYRIYERTANQKANFFVGLKIWAGLEQNQYQARARNPDRTFNFDDAISSKFGVEVEAFFPYFGYKKISVFLSGQISQADNMFPFPESDIGSRAYNVDYSIFELQIGARYYFYVGKNGSFFVEAALAPDFFGNSTVSLDRTISLDSFEERMETQEIGTSFNNRFGASFGLGYSYKRKIYLRAGLRTGQSVIDEGIFFEDTLNRMSLSLGYAFW
ncbi:MAG: hypothetical protein AAF575_02255 [Bacteroidota bacterium]